MCVVAGLLLGVTHGVSGGDEIRGSDSPRLVDLVREAQQSVDRLTAQRDATADKIDNHHGGSPGTQAALSAITRRAASSSHWAKRKKAWVLLPLSVFQAVKIASAFSISPITS